MPLFLSATVKAQSLALITSGERPHSTSFPQLFISFTSSADASPLPRHP
ncbi:MAG: hypothetical protein ACO2PN_05965 [Pyrobaculum sp.]